MRKSRAVPIVTLSAMALAFQACGEDETAYCVDANDEVVENQNCDRAGNGLGGGVFFWMFGSRLGGRVPQRGERISGERVNPLDKATLQSKGGFGSSARPGGIGRTVSAGG